METGLPFVTCINAMSIDWKTYMASGQSKWITGQEARQDVQKLRAKNQAILTGSGTILADNPSMTVRCGVEDKFVHQSCFHHSANQFRARF
jgi:diaminohydroxyphosphoribosylaminopyrimidine deaminase/5-amino-6-(5-phosphoribosylamino)uracil reductase